MDTQSADYLRHRMLRFAGSIEETRNHFGELSAFGRYPASSPYYERSGIRMLLESVSPDPGTCGELLREFKELDLQLIRLEQELGQEYRCRLRDELSAYTERYHSAVCLANTGLLNFETDHEWFYRDRISVLVRELEQDHDLREIKKLIRMLDRNLFPSREHDGEEIPESFPLDAGRLCSMSEMDKIRS